MRRLLAMYFELPIAYVVVDVARSEQRRRPHIILHLRIVVPLHTLDGDRLSHIFHGVPSRQKSFDFGPVAGTGRRITSSGLYVEIGYDVLCGFDNFGGVSVLL